LIRPLLNPKILYESLNSIQKIVEIGDLLFLPCPSDDGVDDGGIPKRNANIAKCREAKERSDEDVKGSHREFNPN